MRSFWPLMPLVLVLPLMLGASAANQAFETLWQAKLCAEPAQPRPPHIKFSYHGPITEQVGPLCYHFAGYNETCLSPQRWLTPATTIELITPGQVPAELLQGYILLVRFPWRSDALYSFPLANTKC